MEGPIRASEGRIDYLKFVFPANSAEDTVRLVENFEGRWEALRSNFADWPGSFHKSRVYDGRGNWLQCFDIAGSAAHMWLYRTTLEELGNITRIDVRAEISTSLNSQQIDAVYETARGLNSRARNLSRKHSRARTKADGRDAGGDLFSCGSLKSDKYFAVYTKPNERTAFELKLSGKPLTAVLQAAKQAERASRQQNVPYGAADYLLTRLQNMLRHHSREVTGNSPREWDETFSRQEVEEQSTGLLTPPERVLSLFDQLDEEQQFDVFQVMQGALFGRLTGEEQSPTL